MNLSVKSKTAYQWSLLSTADNLAEYLVDKRATVSGLEIEEMVISHIKGGFIPIDDIIRVIGATTSLEAAQRCHPSALHETASKNDVQTASRLLAVGFDANAMFGRRSLTTLLSAH